MAMRERHAFEIDVEDVEYLRHGDKPLLARLFKPRGTGLFPAMVELHGGAWCMGDRTRDVAINEPLAKSGILVAALDFRMPPEASYPASFADINYGVRWLKAHARELHVRPDRIGILGSSSGGHQAMLAAMRPNDPRYTVVKLPMGMPSVDARLCCVVMCWPVIDPLARYRYAKAMKQSDKPRPALLDQVLPLHDAYWQSEQTMAEGNPVLALERGEQVDTPPALYIQGASDIVHPRVDLDRFVSAYQRAGGRVQLELLDGEAEGFIVRNPASSSAAQAVQKIISFVKEHTM
jgi:acetyl esterase/lipase